MSHDHAHQQSPPNSTATLGLATLLTLVFAGVEAGVGLWAGSLALVADAGHMVNDAAARRFTRTFTF
jgi:cobalt-zinc-cadmium efflux system protein